MKGEWTPRSEHGDESLQKGEILAASYLRMFYSDQWHKSMQVPILWVEDVVSIQYYMHEWTVHEWREEHCKLTNYAAQRMN